MTEYLIAGEILVLLMLIRTRSILLVIYGHPSAVVYIAFVCMIAMWPLGLLMFCIELVRALMAEERQ